MIVDEARALRGRIAERMDIVSAEFEQLQQMHDALEAFIEQPRIDGVEAEDTRTLANGAAAGIGRPVAAPIQSPPAGPSIAPRDEASQRRARGAVPPPASLSCPDCDFTSSGRRAAQALGSHRRTHRVRPMPGGPTFHPGDPAAELAKRRATTPRPFEPRTKRDGSMQCPTCSDWFLPDRFDEHRQRRHGYRPGKPTESFLCARCPEAFPTRAELDAHSATHPADPPGRPVGRQTVGYRADV